MSSLGAIKLSWGEMNVVSTNINCMDCSTFTANLCIWSLNVLTRERRQGGNYFILI